MARERYVDDPIGNRQTYTDDGLAVTYAANQLNQYDRWDRPGGSVARERYEYDADGNLCQSYVAGDMNCDGVVDFGDVNLFQQAMTCSLYPDPEACWAQVQPNCPYLNADINGDGNVDFGDINPFVAMQTSGNTAVARTYTGNGENRLIAVEPSPGTEQDGQFKTDFAYDHMGRRVRKQVAVWDETLNGGAGGWSSDPLDGAYVRKFVWQDWLMLAELDGSDAVVRQYTWGLDLAGLGGAVNDRTSAGGIGGLLAVHQAALGSVPGGDYVYCHDAIGNVGQVVDLAAGSAIAALVARYEYDPYGNIVGPDTNWDGTFDALDDPGPYAAENPIRFSTKYWDDETGLGYWGYRYYSPGLGRWLSRDPLLERAFRHVLYFQAMRLPTSDFPLTALSDDSDNPTAYALNCPLDRYDPHGLACEHCGEPPRCRSEWDPWCHCVSRCRIWNCKKHLASCVEAIAPGVLGAAFAACAAKVPPKTPPLAIIKGLCLVSSAASGIVAEQGAVACLSMYSTCLQTSEDARIWCVRQVEKSD